MDKEKALKVLEKGGKITHVHFTDNEFIRKHPKSTAHYLDEDDNVLSIKDFWRFRQSGKWLNNWETYVEKRKKHHGYFNKR